MDIYEIKSKIRIEEIIGEYVHLQYKNDTNLKCCCPFHGPEKTPSMLVETQKQFFICFGCGIKGDVIKFVSLINNIDYQIAYNVLAKKIGILVEETELELFIKIQEFYVENLKYGIKYLEYRKFNEEICNQWGLGYSGTVFELYENFKSYKKELIELGLIKHLNPNTPGEIFPAILSERITFPLHTNLSLVGFAGRSMGQHENKYLNIPDNKYYHKDSTLFGLRQALPYMKETKTVNLVEGFFDTIRMHEKGYFNTVNSMGTSFTLNQCKILSNYVNMVNLIFDGDEAGNKAIKNASKELIKTGLNFNVLLLPEKADPNSFLLENEDLDSIETYNQIDIVKTIFSKDEFFKLIKPLDDKEIINKDLLNLFKINLENYSKRVKHTFKSSTISGKVDKWVNLRLFCDIFPEYKDLLNEDEIDLIEEQGENHLYLELQMNNFYKKVKNPTEVFHKLKDT